MAYELYSSPINRVLEDNSEFANINPHRVISHFKGFVYSKITVQTRDRYLNFILNQNGVQSNILKIQFISDQGDKIITAETILLFSNCTVTWYKQLLNKKLSNLQMARHYR